MPVSGIVLLAKTSKALERLSALFRDGGVHKTYWALCCERPRQDEGLLEDWLWRNEALNKSFICREGQRRDAKLARLRYRFLGSTDRYHLLEVQLLTGRHHQIRCQLSHMGCPIKGDLKYGAPRSNPDGSISLHARHIRFIHPVRKEEIQITAPVPASWKGPASLFQSVLSGLFPSRRAAIDFMFRLFPGTLRPAAACSLLSERTPARGCMLSRPRGSAGPAPAAPSPEPGYTGRSRPRRRS